MNYFYYICTQDRITTNAMAQVSMTVRMDSGLKASFDSLCSQFGMSANTAMNIFARAVVQRGKIPFEIHGDEEESLSEGYKAYRKIRALAESGAFPEMSLEEINKEIANARKGNDNA